MLSKPNLQVLEHQDFLTIYLDEGNGWLYNQWVGPQSAATVPWGCTQVISLVRRFGVRKILNDNSRLSEPWAGAQLWVEQQFLPQVAEAGVEAIAWVSPPAYYSQLAVRLERFGTRRLSIFPFDSLAIAQEWLRQM